MVISNTPQKQVSSVIYPNVSELPEKADSWTQGIRNAILSSVIKFIYMILYHTIPHYTYNVVPYHTMAWHGIVWYGMISYDMTL